MPKRTVAKTASRKRAKKQAAKKTAKTPPKASIKRRVTEEPQPEVNIVKFKAQSHIMRDTAFGQMGIPLSGQFDDVQSVCDHDLPLIPLRLFYQVLSWQREIAKEHRCEAHTSLFLMEDGSWVAEPFYQENDTSAMTIKVDYFSDKNKEMYEDLVNKSQRGIHATIHNHVNSPAGQSQTDVEDERGLCGPHITLGNMAQKEIDFHARFSVLTGGVHHFVPMRLHDIVALPLPSPVSWNQVEMVEKLILTSVPEIDYPQEWEDRFQLKYAGATTVGKHQGAAARSQSVSACPTTTRVSSKDIKEIPIKLEEIKLNLAPWSLLVCLDCTNFAKFRESMDEKVAEMEKPVGAIMTEHGLSTHEIFMALSAKKLEAKLPLKPPVQAAK